MKVLKKDEVWDLLHRGSSARMPAESNARFNVGDKVIAKLMNHPGHIRLPEYVQGCEGVVSADQGAFIFPDVHEQGEKRSERLYSVRFEDADLECVESSQSPSAVYVDLFESYLDVI